MPIRVLYLHHVEQIAGAENSLRLLFRHLDRSRVVPLFAGPVREPRDFYRRLDCFVLPSLDEGFGLVLLEAMATGLPVIATRVGGVPEILEHGRNGLLVEPGDAGAIADGIRALWTDADRRERLVEGARQTVTRFDIARTAAQVQAAYEALP